MRPWRIRYSRLVVVVVTAAAAAASEEDDDGDEGRLVCRSSTLLEAACVLHVVVVFVFVVALLRVVVAVEVGTTAERVAFFAKEDEGDDDDIEKEEKEGVFVVVVVVVAAEMTTDAAAAGVRVREMQQAASRAVASITSFVVVTVTEVLLLYIKRTALTFFTFRFSFYQNLYEAEYESGLVFIRCFFHLKFVKYTGTVLTFLPAHRYVSCHSYMKCKCVRAQPERPTQQKKKKKKRGMGKGHLKKRGFLYTLGTPTNERGRQRKKPVIRTRFCERSLRFDFSPSSNVTFI